MSNIYKLPPTGVKRRWFDPCLTMRPTAGSTMGRVTAKTEGDPFDDIDLEFRGKSIKAKAAHPEISVGQLVNVFEWPEGMFWGTCLQPSWYLQSVEDLVKNRRPSQAAMNHLMRKNPKYWPALIRIDKRGQNPDDGDDGDGGSGNDDGSKVGPDGWNDWNDDGFMDRDEWAMAGHNPADFDAADANGDGKISPEEYAAWLTRGMSDHLNAALLAYLLQYSWVGLYEYGAGEAGAAPSHFNQTYGGNTHHSSLSNDDFAFFGIYENFVGTPVTVPLWVGPFNLGGLRYRYYIIGAYNLAVPFECNFAEGLAYFSGSSASTGDPSDPVWLETVNTITADSQAANLAAQQNNATITIIDHNVATRFAQLRPALYSSTKVFPTYAASLSFYNAQTF